MGRRVSGGHSGEGWGTAVSGESGSCEGGGMMGIGAGSNSSDRSPGSE